MDGENLRVVDVPEARIDASPDLDFRIAGREILVKGEVKIPLARIQPADLTNAVLPSADERTRRSDRSGREKIRFWSPAKSP